MKPKLIAVALLFFAAAASPAAPLAFPEISLLVRLRESDAFIVQQTTQRRLLHALSAGEEARLKQEGASDSLLRALRNPSAVLPAAEAIAFENWRDEQKQLAAQKLEAQTLDEERARIASAAAWKQAQDKTATPARAAAEIQAASADAEFSTDYDAAPYPDGGYGAPIGRPGSAHNPTHPIAKAPPAASLQWKNGTATTPSGPGIILYPLGSNGSNGTVSHSVTTPQTPTASPSPVAHSGGDHNDHSDHGGPGGRR